MPARAPAARGARRERCRGRGKGDNGVGGQMGQRWINFVIKEVLLNRLGRRRDWSTADALTNLEEVFNSTCRGATLL